MNCQNCGYKYCPFHGTDREIPAYLCEDFEQAGKETESCEIEEKVEMDMIRNFEKLLTDHPDMCCEVEPKDYPPYLDYPKERKPMTNYDLIISKSLKQLAEKMVDYSYCPPGTACKPTCKECWIDWLKSQVNLEAGK